MCIATSIPSSHFSSKHFCILTNSLRQPGHPLALQLSLVLNSRCCRLMAAGSTFCSCLYYSCSGGGRNHSAPLSSLEVWQWKHQHCSLWTHHTEPLRQQCSQGLTITTIMARPRCDIGVHSPPHAPGTTTGLLINPNSLSSSQSPVHPDFFRCICLQHASKKQMELYTFPWFPIAGELLFNVCTNTQADRKAQSSSHPDNKDQK